MKNAIIMGVVCLMACLPLVAQAWKNYVSEDAQSGAVWCSILACVVLFFIVLHLAISDRPKRTGYNN